MNKIKNLSEIFTKNISRRKQERRKQDSKFQLKSYIKCSGKVVKEEIRSNSFKARQEPSKEQKFYKSISLVNEETKILNKMLANLIQQ